MSMNSYVKKGLYGVGALCAVFLLFVFLVLLKDGVEYLQINRGTSIEHDGVFLAQRDTTYNIDGVEFKMIGIQGGTIWVDTWKGKTKLDDFYIGETEVTQELWTAVMGENPSCHQGEANLPVENVSLDECLAFLDKMDSLTNKTFYLVSYPHWLYTRCLDNELADGESSDNDDFDDVAWLKKNSDKMTHPVKTKCPDRLGLYDMVGNVKEWTVDGSISMCFVTGGSYNTDIIAHNLETREMYYCELKDQELGLRLMTVAE